MIDSDSLDRITLDSDDVQTLERFENHYYNHKNNIMQNGGASDDFLREPIQKIIMLIFSKIKFSDKILLTFSQVPQSTKKTQVPPTRALPGPPVRALPALPALPAQKAQPTTQVRALPATRPPGLPISMEKK